MEICEVLSLALLALVFIGKGVSGSAPDDNTDGYWPTRSELVMPGGRLGVPVPVSHTEDSPHNDQSTSPRRRSKTVVVAVRPAANQRSNPQQQQQQQQPDTLSSADWQGRQRNKQVRLFQLQQQIMRELRLNGKPNVSGSESLTPRQIEKLELELSRRSEDRRRPGSAREDAWDTETDVEHPSHTGDEEYNSKRVVTLPAVCPEDSEDWFTDGPVFRLYFLIDPPYQTLDRKTRVASAVLRLHRKSFGTTDDADGTLSERGGSADDGETDEDDDERRTLTQRERSKRGQVERIKQRNMNRQQEKNRQRYNDRSRRTVDRRKKGTSKLTLDIYQYTQPVQQNVPEIKLRVKSLTLRYPYLEGSGYDWTKINVKAAVREWYKDSDINHGLEIVITDETGRRVDPRAVFYGFNCSQSTSPVNSAALMSLSMRDEEADLQEQSQQQVSARRMASLLPDVTLPNLYISTVDTPRRDRRRKLRRRSGDSKRYP